MNAVAAVVSIFVPGLGHAIRGRVGAGIGWFAAVIVGYVCLVVPGLILHLCCIVSASK